MLNRRHLRIKTLQALYAYYQVSQCYPNAGESFIQDRLNVKITDPQPDDLELLKIQITQTVALFKNLYNENTHNNTDLPEANIKLANETLIFTHKLRATDMKKIKNGMLLEAEQVYDLYIATLKLLTELSNFVLHEEARRLNVRKESNPAPKHLLKFGYHPITEAIKNHPDVMTHTVAKLDWQKHKPLVANIYRDYLKKDQLYIDYQQLPDADVEIHTKILRHIAKNIILKNEYVADILEEVDLYWPTNQPIVIDLVINTIKSYAKKEGQGIELLDLSANWEDDKRFFADLFDLALDNTELTSELLKLKLKNWDVDRVALIDTILIKMAVAEVLSFPSIPIKVTINEYIELAKMFGTPKSKEFINGLLEQIFNELKLRKLIKKSGRGLIDNQ